MTALPAGSRVRLAATVRHQEFAGKEGVVKRYVKSRDVYDILLADGRRYRAFPANVEVL